MPLVYAVGAFQVKVTELKATTVKVVFPVIPLDSEDMLHVPAPVAVASPLEPAALLIVATFMLEELHVAEVVISCVDPSE
jgi:hypothetical protein